MILDDDYALMAGLVSPEEVERLILAFADVRGDRGFSEAEAQQLIAWARHVRFWNVSINLVLKGEAFLDIDDEGEGVLVARPEQQ